MNVLSLLSTPYSHNYISSLFSSDVATNIIILQVLAEGRHHHSTFEQGGRAREEQVCLLSEGSEKDPRRSTRGK